MSFHWNCILKRNILSSEESDRGSGRTQLTGQPEQRGGHRGGEGGCFLQRLSLLFHRIFCKGTVPKPDKSWTGSRESRLMWVAFLACFVPAGCSCPVKAIHGEGKGGWDLSVEWLGHTEKSHFRWPSWAAALALKTAGTMAAHGIPGDSANPPWKGPSRYQHFGKERVLAQECQQGDAGHDLNKPVSREPRCSYDRARARATAGRVPSLSYCRGPGGLIVLWGAPDMLPCVFIPRAGALICLSPSSQELVREMVDADVELMKNNPNAWALAGPGGHRRTHARGAPYGQHRHELPQQGWMAAPPHDDFIAGLPVRESPVLSPPSTLHPLLVPLAPRIMPGSALPGLTLAPAINWGGVSHLPPPILYLKYWSASKPTDFLFIIKTHLSIT